MSNQNEPPQVLEINPAGRSGRYLVTVVLDINGGEYEERIHLTTETAIVRVVVQRIPD